MLNPIPHSDFFATKSIRDMIEEIDRLPNKKERALAYLFSMQMMNACHKAVAEEILYTEVKEDLTTPA
jgi:hypothetical protein